MRQGRAGRLSWRALEPFGVEIEGDLSRPLTTGEGDTLRELFYEHELVLARGQTLSLTEQQALARHIGPVLSGGRGMEYVAPDDGVLNETALTFHSDLAFAPEPFQALSLHALEVAEGRTSTRFASGRRAYERLPESLKARLEGLEAVSVSVDLGAERMTPFDIAADSINRTWDVVRIHPMTGRRFLYVSESHAACILGLPREESDGLLAELFAVLYAADNRVEHPWRNGDLLLWDNLALQHGRPDLTGIRPRRLQRAAVAERSVTEQIPDYFARIAAPPGDQARA